MKLLDIRQLPRLVTHEDYLYSHKILGVLCLGHFIYRTLYNVEFQSGILFWIFIHMSLHLTSFVFKLSTVRNKTYNIIWPEMRWHSMIFAYRSLLTMYIQYLANLGYLPDSINMALRGATILLTMYLADVVTKHYKNTAESNTMRDNPYPKYIPEWFKTINNIFYSLSQVYATMNILAIRDMRCIFNILIPIQTAPFCMTLVKKGIIDQVGWHIYYTAALAYNYYYTSQLSVSSYIISKNVYKFFVISFAILRFYKNYNKYMLWSAIITSVFIISNVF